MAGRIVLAALISAVLIFAWGFLYWGVFNVGAKILDQLPIGMSVGEEMKSIMPGSGMYVYPFPTDITDEQAQTTFKIKHEKGPIFRLVYQAEGGPMMPASTIIKGLVLNFVVALIAAALVAMAGRGLPRFDSRFCFVMLMTLMGTLWANVGDTLWWNHTMSYCLGNMAYVLGAGFLMSIVIGSLVRPPAAEATEEVAAE